MSTHKHFDKICCVVLAITLLLTVLFVNAESFGIQKAASVLGYEGTLFDTSTVHTINIIMDDWDEFIVNCKNEEYYSCAVVIDNEAYKNVAIRAKGNTSLTQVESYGNNRYSFKIEFDHYDSTKNYYGLDKLCLNNLIQDNTYMKDYLTYQMMAQMGVASPLCSYANIMVNGEDWGFYLAVESIEESFLQRNYGKNYGELYKPDSQSMGGGRGNGEKFNMDDFIGQDNESETSDNTTNAGNTQQTVPEGSRGGNLVNPSADRQMPGGMQGGRMSGGMQGGQISDGMQDGQMPDGMQSGQMSGNMQNGKMHGGDKGGMANGSDDVLLKYIDDNIDSYANIFNNAKTDISDSDKERLIAALKKLSSGEELTDTVAIEKVIRYFVVHNFVLNFDSYTGSMIHNYYLYEKDGQMQMIPWDYNLAFGGFESADGATNLVNYPIDSPVSGGNAEDRPMLAWIFANEEYTQLYHQCFAEFISEYFDSGYFGEMIDRVSSMIAPYVEKDPTKFCTYEEFETGISTLKKFCLLRAESISGQLEGTIGSTSDTQENNTLIDVGDLQISDMGSMNNSRGEMGEKDGEVPQMPNGNMPSENPPEMPEGNVPSENLPEMPEGNVPSENPPEMPNGNMLGGTPPNVSKGEMDSDFGKGNFREQMQRPDGNGRPDDKEQMTVMNQATTSGASWTWIVVSVVILIAGICFALFCKRRK